MNQRNAIHVPVSDGMTLRTAHFDTLCVDTLCVGSENLSIRVTLSPVLAQELWWICYHCTWEKHVKWSKVPSCVGCAQLGYGRWGRWGQWCLVSKNRLELQRTTMHCQDESCPLCMQTLDETDISFFACPCNYQAIETCHHFSVFFCENPSEHLVNFDRQGLPLLCPLHCGADEWQMPGMQTGHVLRKHGSVVVTGRVCFGNCTNLCPGLCGVSI